MLIQPRVVDSKRAQCQGGAKNVVIIMPAHDHH